MKTRLQLERLDDRRLPANLIPGWDGPEQDTQGDVNGDHIGDTIAVSQIGGSAHVMVFDGKTGATLGNFIAFDPSFRGGGNAYVAQATPGHPATLIVGDGPGGGPMVEEYQFHDGGMEIVNSILVPYPDLDPDEYRGGVQISAGPINAVGDPPDALFLTGAGVAPRLVALNLDTGAVDASFWVGPADDLDGDIGFEPTGGTITTPDHKLGVVVQQGAVVDDFVPTRIYELPGGADVTSEFAGEPLPGDPF